MPSHLTVPNGTGSAVSGASSFTLVGSNPLGSEVNSGAFSFAELEEKDPIEQVRLRYFL